MFLLLAALKPLANRQSGKFTNFQGADIPLCANGDEMKDLQVYMRVYMYSLYGIHFISSVQLACNNLSFVVIQLPTNR